MMFCLLYGMASMGVKKSLERAIREGGSETFARAWSEGRTMTLEQAVARQI